MAVDALYYRINIDVCIHVSYMYAIFVMLQKIDVIFRGWQHRVRVVQEFKNSRRVLANTKAKDGEATLSNTLPTDAAPPIEPIK